MRPDSAYPYILMSELGIDPFSLPPGTSCVRDLVSVLEQVSRADGGGLSAVSLVEYLALGRPGPAVLQKPSGETDLVIGAVHLDGSDFLQIVGVQDLPQLVPVGSFDSLGEGRLLVPHRRKDARSGVELELGAAKVFGEQAMAYVWTYEAVLNPILSI